MTTEQKIARRKLSLLELAADLVQGLQAGGLQPPAVLRDPPQLPDLWCGRTDRPAARSTRTAPQPGRRGCGAGDPGARPCASLPRTDAGGAGTRLARHPGLVGRRARRLAAPRPAHQARPPASAGEATSERDLQLSDEQVRVLERFSPEFRERHIEAPHTGALAAVDTFFVGHLKGVGRLYLQTAIDCASRHAWAELAKVPPAQQVESQRRDGSIRTSCR